MPASGYLALRSAGSAPAGPARTTLVAVIAMEGGVAGRLGGDWPEVPVPVATALAHAVREALANVVSHADTGEAWVELRTGAGRGSEPDGPAPGDPAVRERCARYAAALRRALAGRAPQAAGLLAELQPALSAAQARGLPLEIQVLGDPGQPGQEVADATLAAVDGVFRALPPHPVTLTVLASGPDVELYVAFAHPPRGAPEVSGLTGSVPASAGWRAAVDVDETGAGCLEVRWRKEEAA